jgi:hypothetical protein
MELPPPRKVLQSCVGRLSISISAHWKIRICLNRRRQPRTFFRFTPTGTELSVEQRRSLHENWILAKAFQELMRGVRSSLEEAYFFVELLSAGQMTAKSNSTLDEILAPFRKKANDMNFPTLLASVNARLDQPLEFTEAYRSMQNARNCLEHRNGFVGRTDARPDGTMELGLPWLKMFILRDGEEVEIYENIQVRAGEEILARIEVRKLRFGLGDRLSISAADFDQIAFACFSFASQLGQRLPKKPVFNP